jgi:hypothetical protein
LCRLIERALGRAGFEHPPKTPGKIHIPPEGGAKCGALSGDCYPKAVSAKSTDPDFAAVSAATDGDGWTVAGLVMLLAQRGDRLTNDQRRQLAAWLGVE